MKALDSQSGKPIRKYRFLRSAWVRFTLFVFLSLLCTVSIIVILFFIWRHFGWFSGNIRPASLPFVSFALISIIFGSILSLIFARFISKPIKNLSEATRKVSSGDFSVQLPVTSNTDMAQLTSDFNKMVQELGSIETLRNDFIANVSHEFKTPIAAIDGYASLLQEEHVSDEERIEYARFISESAGRLSVLISNILRLSKLENQSFVPESTTYSLDEQIRRCILTLENRWSEKDLELDIELEPTMITNCQELLEQVWLNIIGNAVKFTENGGKITVTLKSGSECVVSVKDTGIGMSESDMEHIFDKFYQGDGSRSRQGNGLGLALAKQIIDLLDGNIAVKSAPGAGSEFIVTIPIYK